MQIAMIGVNRMGGNVVRRLLVQGHECVVYGLQAPTVASLQRDGAVGTSMRKEWVSRTTTSRLLWWHGSVIGSWLLDLSAQALQKTLSLWPTVAT